MDKQDKEVRTGNRAIWAEVNFHGRLYSPPENPNEGDAYIDAAYSEDESYIRFFNAGTWSEPFEFST